MGKSTFEDARAVILRHGGGLSTLAEFDPTTCSPEHCGFEARIIHYPLLLDRWGQHLNLHASYRLVRELPRFGLQDWDCWAEVWVNKGRVTYVGYEAIVRGSQGWVLGRHIEEFKTVPEYLSRHWGQRSYYLLWFNITTVGGGEGIDSVLTPQASTDERERAHSLDFQCLTKRGGCSSLCQFAPTAFADFVKETGRVPSLDEHDPNCAKFKPLAANHDNAKQP